MKVSFSLRLRDSGDSAVRLPGLVQVPTIILGSVAKDLSGLTFFLCKMALTKSPSERLHMFKDKSSWLPYMLSKLYFIIISSLLFLLSTSIPPLLKLYFSENRKASSLVERGNLLPGQKPNTYTVGNPSPLTYRPSYSSFLKGFPDSPESWLRSSRPRFQKWSAR